MRRKKSVIIFLLILSLAHLDTSLFAKDSDSFHTSYFGLFNEWPAKSTNSKPDQIRIDPFDKDIVWFTQPNNHSVSRFNFKTKTLLEFTTDSRYRPDGLAIDKGGILWFGEQSAGTIGSFNPISEKFNHYTVPYEDANPAIPTVDNKGTIWLSDHKNNKIINFDPKSNKFRVITLPVNDSWVVDLKEDKNGNIWYSCYASDRIGFISKDRKYLTEYILPRRNLGPSFFAIGKNNIWISLWKSNKIASFNMAKEEFTLYEMPLSNPGPAAMAISPIDDRIYFSTKYLNSVVMLKIKDPTLFYIFKIPTNNSGQKDGLAVDKDGLIWLTEFDKNKFARLLVIEDKDTKDKAKLIKAQKLKARIIAPLKKAFKKKYIIRY